jgi:hypothetical protein
MAVSRVGLRLGLTAGLLATPAASARAQAPTGPEFTVNTYTTNGQRQPSIAVAADGSFVIAWSSSYQEGGPGVGAGIYAQRYDAAGAPRGTEFRVNVEPTFSQETPAMACDRDGAFVAAWWDRGLAGPPNVPGRGIQARRFDASGSPLGGDFLVTATRAQPRVAMAANGRFVVAWYVVAGGGSDVAAQPFDADGTPAGPAIVVNTYTVGDQLLPDVASDAAGNFVVVWEDRYPRDGSFAGVFARRFDSSGHPVAAEFQVNTYTPGNQAAPTIAMAPAGEFVVAWRGPGPASYHAAVLAQRFDRSGNPVGAEFVANSTTSSDQFVGRGGVAMDANGNFVVVWKQDSGFGNLFGQRFSAAGARRGAEFRIDTGPPGIRGLPVVGSDAVGNFVTTWDDYSVGDGDLPAVLARRFGGLEPTSLRVDTSRNGILEPGEIADVRPTWRNGSGSGQALGATLASPGGPPGGAPVIVDAAATYGTVPDGAAAECTVCFRIQIPSPPNRPAAHWDATAAETIVPDIQGQQKTWLLHVGETFPDVTPASPYYRFVETLVHRNVTAGCAASAYCPAASTTREQMAVFVLVARERAGYAPAASGASPMFPDVPPSSPFCPWVEELARRGVVAGCGGGNYCPRSPVTREQMAVFVLRTLDPALSPPACAPPNLYGDVSETSPFCPWVEELTNRGVVTGCGGGNYCPALDVSRDQMAVFITVTFGLTLYGV